MSGTEVGTAWVTVVPSARGFAKRLQQDIASEFAGSGIDKMIADAIGSREIKLPVKAELDTSALSDPALRQRITLPVDIDRRGIVRQVRDAARDAERAGAAIRLPVSIGAGGAAGITGVLSSVRALSSALSSLASLGGTVGIVAAVLGAIGAAAFAAAGSVYVLVGALGSLPAFAAGLGAIAGTLALGFRGLGDAFKEAGGGGGGGGGAAVRSAAALYNAELSLTRSKRSLADATKDLNKARADEVKRIRDLNLNLRRARQDEVGAARDVEDALTALDRANRSGRTEDQERAAEAYQDSLLALEEAKNRTEDLGAESEKAAQVGVEGSDQVQEALQRQQEATESVTAATLALNEALNPPGGGGGGGGGAGAQLTKLAPSAERFVKAIKDLKPAFESLRLGVQEKLFAGLDKSVKNLATAWLPQLTKTLGDYATTFNGFAKDLAGSLSKPAFIENIAIGAESVRGLLEKVGKVVSGPLVDAFGRLSRAAKPFVDALGDELASVLQDFSDWIAKLDGEGKLDSFFQTASSYLRDLFDMGRDVASIIGSLVEILFGSEGDKEKDVTPWEQLRNALDRIAAWFKDPENQTKVREWIKQLQDFAQWLVEEGIPKVASFIGTIAGWVRDIQQMRDRIREFGITIGLVLNTLTSPLKTASAAFSSFRAGATAQLDALSATVRGLPGRITSALGNLNGLLWNAGVSLIGGLTNGIRAAIPGLQSLLGWVTNQIPAWKGPPVRDRDLLKPAGRDIMGGLIGSIHAETAALRAELSTVTGVIAGTPLMAPAMGAYGASAAAAPAPGQLTARWVGEAADPMVVALRDHIRIGYDGSPDVALRTGG